MYICTIDKINDRKCMKSVCILSLASLLFFFSCNSLSKSNDSYEGSKFEKLYEKARKSNVETDSIFMNFRFGMTEEEFQKHSKHLIDIDKAMYVNGRLKCEFKDLNGFNYSAKLKPEYFHGKLFRLYLFIESESSLGTNGDEYVLLFSSFKNTHKNYDWGIEKDIDNKPMYIATNNNLVVVFVDNTIIYENAHVAPLYQKEKEIQDSIEFSKTF